LESEPAGSIAPPLDARDILEPPCAVPDSNNRRASNFKSIDDPIPLDDDLSEVIAPILGDDPSRSWEQLKPPARLHDPSPELLRRGLRVAGNICADLIKIRER